MGRTSEWGGPVDGEDQWVRRTSGWGRTSEWGGPVDGGTSG